MDNPVINKRVYKIDSDSVRLIYDYLPTHETIISNQLLKVSLSRWYIIDKYIDEYISSIDDRESYKNWIRLVRKNEKGPIFLTIKPFNVYTKYLDDKKKIIVKTSYSIILSNV
jgi:hypothetical protein